MAIRRSSVIGHISGKLEDTVTRYRYGKYIVYSKPDKYNISHSKEAVIGRAKFANTVRLARLLNSFPEISSAWKASKIRGTNGYQKIIKYNAAHASHKGITIKNIITPPGSFASLKSLELDENKIVFNCLAEEEFLSLKPVLFALLSLKNKGRSKLIMVSSGNVNILGGQNVVAVVELSKTEKRVLTSSRSVIILAAFISYGNKTKWTSTFSSEIDLKEINLL